MIQRKQTLWLLLCAITNFCSLQWPIFVGLSALNAAVPIHAQANLWLEIVTIATGVLALLTIFLYNLSALQIKINVLSIVLQCAVWMLFIAEIKKQEAGGYFTIASILPIVSLVALVFSLRLIIKDRRTIADSNRLR